MHRIVLFILCGCLGVLAAPGGAAAESRLDLIKKRGSLIAGVKADYPPWGDIDKNGRIIGFEPDLARDIAARLGVNIELVKVTAVDRLQKLEEGTVDIVVATMADTVQRRQISGLIEPNYYASGVNLLSHGNTFLTDWSQLRGRQVCLTQGAYFNRVLIQRYLIDPQVFKDTRDSKLALRDGLCIGWAYDDTVLTQVFIDPQWQDYKMPLQSILISPWAIAVRKAERDTAYGRFVSDVVADWHRTGFLLDKEAAWGLPPNKFLIEQNAVWNLKNSDGGYYCQRDEAGKFPLDCLTQQRGQSTMQSTASGLGAILQSLSIDFSPGYDAFDRKVLIKGVLFTTALSTIAIAGSLLFGVIFAVIIIKSSRAMGHLISGLISILRMTPPLLHLYIVFFGVGGLVTANYGWTLDAFLVASVIFSLYAGSANAAILAHAFEYLVVEHPGGTVLALLPEAVEQCYESLVANSVNIVKAVGIASTIAVPELISATTSIIADRGNAMEMMNFLLIFYFGFVCVCLFLLKQMRFLVSKWAHKRS